MSVYLLFFLILATAFILFSGFLLYRYMTNQRFPLRHLPNDICLKILKTMEYHEIIVFSLTSKKALSLVKALHLPITSIRIIMSSRPSISFEFGDIYIKFELNMQGGCKTMISLNDVPVNVEVLTDIIERNLELTMSNQGMCVGKWIQYLCSIFDKDTLHEVEFYVGEMELDTQALRNTLPKFQKIIINGWKVDMNQSNQSDVFYAETILRAFLPDVQSVELFRVHLGDNLSIQHIGMANLKELEYFPPISLNFDPLFAWNFEKCYIDTVQMSLRDLNRFFKLWIKRSNPKLKEFHICCEAETDTDWNVLMKGLKAKEAEAKGPMMNYIIENCRGISAELKIRRSQGTALIKFNVLN